MTGYWWVGFNTPVSALCAILEMSLPSHTLALELTTKPEQLRHTHTVLMAIFPGESELAAASVIFLFHLFLNCTSLWTGLTLISKWKKKDCALAVVRWRQKFHHAADPFLRAWVSENLISWRWSLPLPRNPVWWGSMHAISSYRGNRPTYTHIPRQDRLQYTVLQLVRSVTTETGHEETNNEHNHCGPSESRQTSKESWNNRWQMKAGLAVFYNIWSGI